ncbi:SDR family NAD(P)-dependent oxidoreductase [Chloroflexota bacterium]
MPYLAKLEKAGIPTVIVDLEDQHNMVEEEAMVNGIPHLRYLPASRTLPGPEDVVQWIEPMLEALTRPLTDKEKVAVVTGGASGIGKAASLLMAREGAAVAVTDITDEAGKEVVDEITNNGGSAAFWHMNVADEQEVEKVFSEINTKYGKINILVNNAGIPGSMTPTHELPTEEWHRVIDIDLNGVFYCTKHVIEYMKKSGVGSIVNMSSMLGLIGGADIAYHAAKGGVRLMTKSDASVYAPDNIRVNSIHPGYIMTPMFRNVARNSPVGEQAFYKQITDGIPAGRLGEPEDVARTILWLASDDSDYITGLEVIVDGGFILQ